MGNAIPSVTPCYSSSYSEVQSYSSSPSISPVIQLSPEDREINELNAKKAKLQKQILKIKLEEEIRVLEMQVEKGADIKTTVDN